MKGRLMKEGLQCLAANWPDRDNGKHSLVLGAEVNVAGHDGDDAHRYQERALREAVRRAAEAQGTQP